MNTNIATSRDEAIKHRILGEDPKSGRPLSVRMGKYGPMLQIGTRDDEEKPRFASIPRDINMNEISFEQALKCFELPRFLGIDGQGIEIETNIGRYGPYIKIGKEFFSLPKDQTPYNVNLETAIEIIKVGRETKAKKIIHEFGLIKVLEGKYGPYINFENKNYKIPKDFVVNDLNEEKCKEIISNPSYSTKKKRRKFKK